MTKDYFNVKIKSEYIITTSDVDYNFVSKKLNITPHRFFNKGEKINSKHSLTQGTQNYGLWAIRAKEKTGHNIDTASQINYYKNILFDKKDIIQNLINKYKFECILSITIETEDAGAGIDLSVKESFFISQITTRFSMTVVTIKKIE